MAKKKSASTETSKTGRSSRSRQSWRTVLAVTTSVGLALGGALAPGAGAGTAVDTETGSSADHFVSSWATSPTDSVTPIDANFTPSPSIVSDQSLRMAITPHMAGSKAKVRLSNRYGATPVTFGHVTAGQQANGFNADSTVPVTFSGSRSVTLQPGQEIVSDATELEVNSFEPLLVSMHVDGHAGPPTQHWNANATSYMSPVGSGDLTSETSGRGYSIKTNAWQYVTGLEVAAPDDAGAVVAFGDSITDGFVGSSQIPIPSDSSVNDSNHRYPDALQRRLDDQGQPTSMVNAGIGSNQLLVSGEPLFLGAAGVDRFKRDALDLPGVYGAIVLIGINDLGLNPLVTTEKMIDGFKNLIRQADAADKKIWLGTIAPASDALVDGTLLSPNSNRMRNEINDWIRGEGKDLADGMIDFDETLRDPDNPAVMRADYSSPDRLHPNPAGYQAMADTVDLAMISKNG